MTWALYTALMPILILTLVSILVIGCIAIIYGKPLKEKVLSPTRVSSSRQNFPVTNQITFILYCLAIWTVPELFSSSAEELWGWGASGAIAILSISILYHLIVRGGKAGPRNTLFLLLLTSFYQVAAFAGIYRGGLIESQADKTPAAASTAIYLSFSIWGSLGFETVTPMAHHRYFVMIEAALGLMYFGAVVGFLSNAILSALRRDSHYSG